MAEGKLPEDYSPGVTFPLPLWPKWPEQTLRREFRKGAWAFNRGFRQQASKDEDRMFNVPALFLTNTFVKDIVEPAFPRYGGFDPAGERRIGNGLISVALNPYSGQRVIVGIQLWRGSYDETASKVAHAYLEHKYTVLMVENNATQGAVAQLIHVKAPSVPIAGFLTGTQKSHPEYGVPGLAAEVVNGIWALCIDDPYDTGSPLSSHDITCECPYHVFISDLNGFPGEKRPYDLLMAWWFTREAIRSAMQVDEVSQSGEEVRQGIPEEEFGGLLFDESETPRFS